MMRQDLECTVNVENEIQPSERGLVGAHVFQSASGEAIEREGGDAEPVEFARPHIYVPANAAGAMLQYDDGQPSRTLRDAQNSGGGNRRGAGRFAFEELRVRECQRLDGI